MTATPSAPDPAPSSSARQRLFQALRGLDDQRRRTFASALSVLVTLLIWSLALAIHQRFGSSMSPRALSVMLMVALVGAFPAGLLVRRLLLA